MNNVISTELQSRHLYTLPNDVNIDYIKQMMIYERYSLVLTSNGKIQIHNSQDWNVYNEKLIKNVLYVNVVDTNKLVAVDKKFPVIYDFEFNKIMEFKKPIRIRDPLTILDSYSYNDMIASSTALGSILKWDKRADWTMQIISLKGSPCLSSVAFTDDLTIGSEETGIIHIIDNRTFKKISQINLCDLTKKHKISIDRISINHLEPWLMGFQCSSNIDISGVLDLMTNTIKFTVPNPPFVECSYYSKFSPLFIDDSIFYCYPWSNTANIICKDEKIVNIKLPYIPTSVACTDLCYGLFLSSKTGEVHHIF